MPHEDELAVEQSESIATITINRPERANALTSTLLDSLVYALEELTGNDVVRCVVLRGAGDKAFSCGMDLARMAVATPGDNQSLIGPGGPLRHAIEAVERYPYPVVAMVRGFAVGAALELALSCDLRIASEDCRVGMPPARLGIVYPPEGLARFLRALGPVVTKKLFYTASYFGSGDAQAMGIVDYLVADEHLEEFTRELAARLAGNAPLSMKGHKRSLRMLSGTANLTGEEKSVLDRLAEEAFSSRDAFEGIAAFSEKRDPEFKGQ